MEHRVEGEFSPHGLSSVPDNLRVEEKRSLGFPELGKTHIDKSIYNLGTISGEIKPDIGWRIPSIKNSKPSLTWRTRRVFEGLYALLKE